MDYKKKYEKLVDAVKVLRDNNPSDEGIQNWVNDNMPELKEREDERIRKAIIESLPKHGYLPQTNITIKDAIVWLEKQGESQQGKSALEAINEEKVDNQNYVKSTDKVEPKFKVGDRIKLNNSKKFIYTITAVLKDRYRATIDSNDLYEIEFERQDAYKLVPDKFDINTLIPFESKVLVRNSCDGFWMPTFWGIYEAEKANRHLYRNYLTTKGFFLHCIPYNDDTKHLVGTTDDCDEFYKTWE